MYVDDILFVDKAASYIPHILETFWEFSTTSGYKSIDEICIIAFKFKGKENTSGHLCFVPSQRGSTLTHRTHGGPWMRGSPYLTGYKIWFIMLYHFNAPSYA